MCGRFTLTWKKWQHVASALGIEDEDNAATQLSAALQHRADRSVHHHHCGIRAPKKHIARWGLVNRCAGQ